MLRFGEVLKLPTRNLPQNLFNKFFKDKRDKIVIFQSPNLPIILWLVFLILSELLRHNKYHNDLAILSLISLIIWALLEILLGVNYFRRILGLGILLVILINYR